MRRSLSAAVWSLCLIALPLRSQFRDAGKLEPHRPPREDFPRDRIVSSMRGPMLGIVFDERALALRPILGVPGAASFGPRIDTGAPVRLAAVSPAHDAALAVAGENLDVLHVRLRDGAAEVAPVPGAAPGPDRIVFSPSGSAAALHYDSGRVEIVRGLPDAPSIAGAIDLSLQNGDLTALAVDDEGQAVLAAFSDGQSGALYVAEPEGSPRLVLHLGRATAAVFLKGRRDALVADGPGNQVYAVWDATGGAASVVVAGPEQGVAAPIALAEGGGKAFIASAEARRLVVLDLSDGAAASIACECAPAVLEPMSGRAVFRLTHPGAGPLWIYDGDALEARAFFVPPAPRDGEAAERQ